MLEARKRHDQLAPFPCLATGTGREIIGTVAHPHLPLITRFEIHWRAYPSCLAIIAWTKVKLNTEEFGKAWSNMSSLIGSAATLKGRATRHNGWKTEKISTSIVVRAIPVKLLSVNRSQIRYRQQRHWISIRLIYWCTGILVMNPGPRYIYRKPSTLCSSEEQRVYLVPVKHHQSAPFGQ